VTVLRTPVPPTASPGTRLRALLGLPPREAGSAPPPGPDWHPHFGRIAGTDLASWLDAYADAGPPDRSLVLATDERTGSEWLCQLLGATGRLGPSEYLITDWMRRFIPDYPADVAAQVAIAHRSALQRTGASP